MLVTSNDSIAVPKEVTKMPQMIKKLTISMKQFFRCLYTRRKKKYDKMFKMEITFQEQFHRQYNHVQVHEP